MDMVAKMKNASCCRRAAGPLHPAEHKGSPMDWMTTLQPMPELRPMFPVDPGDKSARAGFHVRRAGFGVWAVAYCRGGRLDEQYAAFKAWKADPSGQATPSGQHGRRNCQS